MTHSPGTTPHPDAPPSPLPPPARPPTAVVTAILLMVPTALTWLVAGVAFFAAMARSDGDGKIFLIVIAVPILALCLLVTVITVGGMVLAWRRTGAEGLRIPAAFTFGLFAISLLSLLVQGKLSFHPTMVTPLVVGGLSGVALALLKSRPAKDWFAGNPR
ncbi:hypothetical protein ACGFI9_35955 [Micromonospora sp. NPDC048930]|uniref:hypothetical protein n=1 Tax=Micromonospora sp. NPDC048930 TaxID=3364261 RepID=UPI00371E5699